MKATRIYDHELITSIMTRPDIWEDIAEDGQIESDFCPQVDDECWLLMSDGVDVVGLYNVHARNVITAEIHAHVLPEYRQAHSINTGRAALDWIIKNTTYQKIVANIPIIFENVKKFTCGFGFQVEGINRASYLKNGEIVDQYMLGITRAEIMEYLR